MAGVRTWNSNEVRLVTHLIAAGDQGAFLESIAAELKLDRHSAWLVVTVFEQLGFARSIIVRRETTGKSAVLYLCTPKGVEALQQQS